MLWLAALVAAAFVSSSMGQGPPAGSPPGLDKAIAAKEKNAQRMLDKPGVAGIGVTLDKHGKPVIEIYKEKDDVPDLPDSLDGVAVQSVTTGVIEPRSLPTDRFPHPVPIGVSGGLSGVATGTLGARVTDGTNVYVLSNNHVLAGVNTASIGDPIIQPGDADGGHDPGDRVATLAAYQTINFNGGTNTMDAAIALTSTDNVGTSTPSDGYGAPSPVTATASIGLPVQKYGRTTGLQLGDVAATNVSVDVCYIAIGRLLPAGGAVRRTVLHLTRPIQRARRLRVARRHARREPAGRAALRRWRRSDDRHTNRRRPPAFRRNDRRSAARKRPARRSDRRLRDLGRRRCFADVVTAELRRRLARVGLPCLSRHELRWGGLLPGSGQRDELRRYRAHERDDVLLQGDRRERLGRRRAVQRSRCYSCCPRCPGGAAAYPRRLQPRIREPAVGRGALVEWDKRLWRERALRPFHLGRVLEVVDVQLVAEQRAVRPGCRGLDTRLGSGRRQQPRSAAGAAAGSRHVDLRRLHASHQPTPWYRPDLARAHRQRYVRESTHGQSGTRSRRRSPSAGQGREPRDLA